MGKKMPAAGRPHKTSGKSLPPRTDGMTSGTVRERAGQDTLRTAFGAAWSGSDNAEPKFPTAPKPRPQGSPGS